MTTRPRLGPAGMFNMSFGFLGIQFGWGLQLANMSAVYERLGARSDQVPLLWLAAPVTGLIVQPFIGALSDRTWGRLGRRRPYFLTGAILASFALYFMPTSSSLWVAATLLWVLDASINISMEPFRAFVADKLDVSQRTTGFVVQSLFIGIGASLANALPLFLRILGVTGNTASGIPLTVKYSFQFGAVVFLAAVLWTVVTTSEFPPEDMEAFKRSREEGKGISAIVTEIVDAIREMPKTMRQLGVVQLLTWLGLFCMWLYFGPAVARNVFGAPSENSPLYTQGVEWAGICFAMYSAVCFAFSWMLPSMANRLGRRATHSICLLCGAAGLLSVAIIHDKWLLLLSMAGVGIAWASTLSMPYAILAGCLPPKKTGIYMGIFNFAIVMPEIIASLVFGWVMAHLLGNNRLLAVMAGGLFMILAAALMLRVRDVTAESGALPGMPVQAGVRH